MATINLNALAGRPNTSSAITANGQFDSVSGTRFFAGGEDALAALIQLLQGGGTAEQRQQRTARQQEIGAVRDTRADYTKEAAFADAQGAMSQRQRLALEELIPQINNAALGAGTSQSALRVLMLQDAANKAAESASALGLDAATKYGQISSGMSSTLEMLTRPDNSITDSLLKALEISKGSQSTTRGSGSGSGTRGTTTGIRGSIRAPQPYLSFGGGNSGNGTGLYGDALNKLWAQANSPVDFNL